MTETNRFPLISGNPSIDIVNTEVVRRGERHDLLVSEEDMFEWFQVMKEFLFIDEQLLFSIKLRVQEVLSGILKMRTVLRNEFEAIANGQPVQKGFITFLEEKIEKAPFTFKLIDQIMIPRPVGEVEDIVLSYIAFDALNLIGNKNLAFLKHCANPDCVLLFIDETGRRKWCSMKICGNRKKVERFQRRKNENR
ncbi:MULTISPECIES: CGNR zinc finger domain-containing protein [Bacillaceae]|uniref:Conserved protein containing a Zn-ribbon-like motif, possibly RNA-binding n=2 Tax=Bacillales TaxID=1385 RepID=A0A072NHC2_SCHAZ|nr:MULTISPECIES: CGNR zinc finger domain-containing protein [Bacillaceae]KEF36936.1 conserved protein containing a Zn-ribbon-like motif, possibly RNA-binding [Schinkia azotoformans MEV2011]MEC1695987.1 CGNR zinc finger domain-containing protein [Schinkia azotoformans]MEC1724496.1 CGNR zinc finger domain-containing protein [Schinkia azotoformans]MEC1773400.1 CGNR zinc finger domain-containing protein [Schinkia azotoformans]MED4366091.1 CGNR zinc finger domain-containing protein [Schinkia azotof